MTFWRKRRNSNAGLWRPLSRFVRDRRGNVAAIVAVMVVPLVGILGLAGEVSTWYTVNRSLQNATDAAAVAAAWNNDQTNDSGGVPRYQREANAVASQYGFVNGTNHITVTPTTVNCPGAMGSISTCFQVTITRPVPVLLSGVLGFVGNTTLSGGNAQLISATSIATGATAAATFCVLALGGSVSSGIQVNGGPKTDLAGCNVGSNGDETCNGHNMNADGGYAHYTDNGCGNSQYSNQPLITDPGDAAHASNIPTNPCSSYPQEVNGVAASQNQLADTYTGGGTQIFCGDVQVGTTSVSAKGKATYTTAAPALAAGTVLVIENGTLDIPSGSSLNAASATIVFTGPTVSGLTPSHFPTGGGDLNLTAPTSGLWSGEAIYQDPNLPAGAGVDITAAGNTPTWNVVGMMYLPNSNVTISGAVGKSAGSSCIGLVVNTLTINGTGYLLDHNGCAGDGVTLPGIPGNSVALVQ